MATKNRAIENHMTSMRRALSWSRYYLAKGKVESANAWHKTFNAYRDHLRNKLIPKKES